jgi:hypothetical protein
LLILRIESDSPFSGQQNPPIRRIISDAVRDELAETADKNSTIPRELIVQFVVGAYMAVLTWWLDKGAKLPPAKIDTMFRQLASEGLGSCIPAQRKSDQD